MTRDQVVVAIGAVSGATAMGASVAALYHFLPVDTGLTDLASRLGYALQVNAVAILPLLVAVMVAGLAGVVAFLSPCILPVVPGYLSYVAGLTGTSMVAPAGAESVTDSARRRARGRMLLGAVLFIAFVIVAALAAHHFWTMTVPAERAGHFTNFWKDIAIIGGLVMLATMGGGRYSVDRLLAERASPLSRA